MMTDELLKPCPFKRYALGLGVASLNIVEASNGRYVLWADVLAEIERLTKELAAERNGDVTYCGFCTQEFLEPSWEDLQAHIKECPEHPLGQANAEIERLTMERDEARAAVNAWAEWRVAYGGLVVHETEDALFDLASRGDRKDD
jgi:hypothetical protein